jgi:hypothetical protein
MIFYVRAVIITTLTAALAAAAVVLPPPPPPASIARTQLDALVVLPPGTTEGYSRTKFPHWAVVHGNCDAREVVLGRDGEQVVNDDECRAVEGTWRSPYDGATWRKASDIDIDHMVPLSEAWKSGADDWTTARRKSFANDLDSSQLWAVTDNVNQAKGDKDPAVWKPPLDSFHCTYARSWISVKTRWGLSVDRAEKAALASMLDRCSG